MKRLCTWKRTRVSSIGIFVFAVLVHLMALPAYSSQQVARLSEFTGVVIIQSQGDWGAKPEKDLPLYSTDKVVTRTGTAVVTFNDGAVVHIRANSNLLIEEQETAGSATRNLRLLIGKLLFKTGVGSKAQTNLQTPTAVVGLRGTAGTLSIGLDGKNYIQFTEGGSSYTLGEFISGVAKDVPPELADLNPAQKAAFAAAAAADQAKNAAEAAKEGTITDKQAALAGAKSAEAAAVEAKAAAETMLSNPSAQVAQQAQAAFDTAVKAIQAAQEVQKELINQGVQAPPQTYTPTTEQGTGTVTEATIGFDVTPPSTVITISTTLIPTTTVAGVGMSSSTPPGFLDPGGLSGSVNPTTNQGTIALQGEYTSSSPTAASPVGGTMADGSSFEGHVGGVVGSWTGLFGSIFVTPGGSAGFLTGTLSGSQTGSSLSASGPLNKQVVGTTTVTPSNLYYAMNYDPADSTNWPLYDHANYILMGKVVPDFNSIYVESPTYLALGTPGAADIQGITLTNGSMIGVWSYESSGTYLNPSNQSWSGKWGYDGGGYAMLGDLTLTDDGTGHVGIKGTLNYIDTMHVGAIGVGYAGYNGEGYAAGTYILNPLAYYGVVSSGLFYERDSYGVVQTSGDLTGIMGGAQSPLQGSSSFTGMGAYYNPNGSQLFLQQYVGSSGSDSIILYSAGQALNGSLQNTLVRGISSGPSGLYFLTGSASGSYYESADMWQAAGSIQPLASLTGDVVQGKIGGGGGVTIDKTTRETISPVDNPNWGIFLRSYEGTYQSAPTTTWSAKFGWTTTEPGYYLGDIYGDPWTGSMFEASLSNILYMTPQYKVHAEGTLVGAHAGGIWKGVGAGDWVREPLTFSSILDYRALRMMPGTFYESDFGRSVSGGHDDYEYEYFVLNSGTLLFGRKEFSPYADRSQEEIYLPSGHYVTASEWPPYRVSTRFAAWTVGSLSPSYFTTLPSGDVWTREWYEQYAGYMSWGAGNISGIMGGTGNLWGSTESSPASTTFVGRYVPDDGNYAIPSIFRFNADSSSFTTGAYRGDVVGRIDSQDVDGLFYAVYVDPNQNAGILVGDFSGYGTVHPEISMWAASGSLYPKPMESNVGFGPSSLGDNMAAGVIHARLNGHFGIPYSFIDGEGAGVVRSIRGRDWGTYRFGFTWDNMVKDLASSWSARAGGFGEFGTHARSGVEYIYDTGLWSSGLISGSAINGKIDGSYVGRYLTYTQYGTLGGAIVGTYDTTKNAWHAFSAGGWQKQQDLSFGAIVRNGQLKSEFLVNDGHYSGAGGSYYEYTYYNGFNSGKSHEYDASTNTTIGSVYFGGGWKEQWTDANGTPSYTGSSWTGSLLDVLATGSTFFNSYEPISPSASVYRMEKAGWIEGIIGGLEDPWSATSADPAEIVVLGEYDYQNWAVCRSVFGFDFYSYNPYLSNPSLQNRTVWNQSTNSEYGAFRGFAGGTILNNGLNPGSEDAIEGMLIGLYRDHLGNTGILMGGFVGKMYPDFEGWESTSGAMYPIPLGTTTIPAADFYGSAVESASTGSGFGGYASWGFEPTEADNKIRTTLREGRSLTIPGYPWIISQIIAGGYYEGTPTNFWTSLYDYTDAADGIRRLGTVDGDNWSDSRIHGKESGAWVSYTNAMTGVHGGEVKGTFNPTLLTYQTAAHVAALTTNKFLDMINSGQTDALTKLNIPCIQVGTANFQLMSADPYFSAVNMNNVKFFGYSTGADPRIWATNGVSGSYTAVPPVNHTASLTSTSGGSMSAGFKVNNWSDGKWGAALDGSGSLNRTDVGGTTSIQFKGGAAGTYNSSTGTFSGTGAGSVKKIP
ncbi:MAG: hypothetical protein C4576_12535 [Desulfobacteraceae bacterium]|nr:MAG: hypothetical protein C4576_12535 [Desulfobacteraceae bacterium]